MNTKSRLRKIANHVSPRMHESVQEQVSDPSGEFSKKLYAQEEFVLAKRLLAALPIVPTSERSYELCQNIHEGLFNDISPVEDAMDNWDMWLKRTEEILKSKNVLLAKKKK